MWPATYHVEERSIFSENSALYFRKVQTLAQGGSRFIDIYFYELRSDKVRHCKKQNNSFTTRYQRSNGVYEADFRHLFTRLTYLGFLDHLKTSNNIFKRSLNKFW